jgi:hypothetical protein
MQWQVQKPQPLVVPLAHAMQPVMQPVTAEPQSDAAAVKARKGKRRAAATSDALGGVKVVVLDAEAALAEMLDIGVGLVQSAWLKA